ncbi:MAG: ribonuclease R [Neisseriaceae bacterium]|nr:ribonuclease R [Neisseriaceae bacterium]
MAQRKKSLRQEDPFYQREVEKYGKPLPSREWIIEILEKNGVPLSIGELEKELSIKKREREFFTFRLNAMVRDGQIHINRRGGICVADKIDLVKCTVIGHKDGYGFASPLDKNGEDFALSEKQMRTLMHGDTIAMRPTGFDRRGKRTGRVLEVLERKHKTLVCRGFWERDAAIAQPEDKRISTPIVLVETPKKAFVNGDVIVVKLLSYPANNRPAIGKVVEVLGKYADDGMEIEIALRKHDLPHIFSSGCLKAADKISDKVRISDKKNRENLCDIPLVTIDGESSKDFDDAVFAEKIGRNWRLIVAIADVSHYVKPHSPIDEDARERLTSVYFPRRVIPMLPEKLSNGICSLNPNVERLCMACEMEISSLGNIKKYRFFPAVMKSHARLTYGEVWAKLQSKNDYPLKQQLTDLYGLFKVLLKKRIKRGAADFDSVETQMIFDENGKIEKIVPYQRNDAHRIIEECMLAANVCAAEFIHKNKAQALYRIHEPPTADKLDALHEQLALLGLNLGGGNSPTPADYAALIDKIKDRPDFHTIQLMLLRSLQQAVYSPENKGHFSLAYQTYTHFTSPIRRYPDLVVHRAIKNILSGKQGQPETAAGMSQNFIELGNQSSAAERRADDASREVEKWLKTYFMRDKIGEIFTATVSGMTAFGLFATLDDIYIDGMIHISDLGQDYFRYRPEIMALEGERTLRRYNIGDKIHVKDAKADLDTCRVDLVLAQNKIGRKNKRKK